MADKAADKAVEWVVAGILTALVAWLLLARHWVVNEWACINKQWCEVEGWSLGSLIAFAAAAATAAGYIGFRLYRTQRDLRAQLAVAKPKTSGMRVYVSGDMPFQKITVEDQRLRLRWFLLRPPKEWLHLRDIARSCAPSAVQAILDGPFHAEPECNAELAQTWVGTAEPQPVFIKRCSSCGKVIFRGLQNKDVAVWPVRAMALEELQRMERSGTKFDGRAITLEKPAYWIAMLPP